MHALNWSEALELDLPAMDDTHREFVDLLAAARECADAALPALWDALVAHTEAHFGREDEWMRQTGFAPGNCHSLQHATVLQVLREGAARAAGSDLTSVRQMISELATWFPHHAQTMDAALAQHLRGVGYDVESGKLQGGLPPATIHGCGGACSG